MNATPNRIRNKARNLEVLAALIEKYEAENFPIEPPTPLDASRFGMDQLG